MRTFQMQRISAMGLLVFLTIHMIVVHYPPFHIDFSRIIDRLDQPLWKGIDIAFLLFVLVHALSGAYAVITDVERFNSHQRILAGLAIVIGLLAFVYGTMTILSFEAPTALQTMAR